MKLKFFRTIGKNFNFLENIIKHGRPVSTYVRNFKDIVIEDVYNNS